MWLPLQVLPPRSRLWPLNCPSNEKFTSASSTIFSQCSMAWPGAPPPRAPVPPTLSPKFKGTEEFTFAAFTSKLITMQSRFPDALKTDVDKVNYALQYLEVLAKDDENLLT
ncbi:hypothetical protein BGZ67_002765 [Mortierella alpina]|nr:hypothetical protein BGZ67_002765 [Mortierella alpina]